MQSRKFCGGSTKKAKGLCFVRDMVLEMDFTEWKDFTGRKEDGKTIPGMGSREEGE